MRVVTLAGGTGAAKLLRGLATHLDPRELTVIGNTGDDTEVWGLHVSPDLDTATYALAGLLDVHHRVFTVTQLPLVRRDHDVGGIEAQILELAVGCEIVDTAHTHR